MDDWTHRTVDELETIFREHPIGPVPRGRFVGTTLHYLPRGFLPKAVDYLLFDALPYGIDFDTRRWWFVRPGLQAGRFSVDAGRSAWRSTETLRLHYDSSRLPRPIRKLLYDEVKPLDADTALGIGGMKGPPGVADNFFFLLRRLTQ